MAIYHFRVKTIGRAKGARLVAAAAYRSGSSLYDEELGRSFDFTDKPNVVHSEIMAPSPAAKLSWPDQTRLWNAVEAGEKRRDAQLARELVVAIPRELNEEQGVALVRGFVRRTFVDQGMIADINVHWDKGRDGETNPHAHVMLTTRRIVEDGGDVARFGFKVREWNTSPVLMRWRQAWSEDVNAHLARLQIDTRIDHRSNRDRGIGLEPQRRRSLATFGLERRGEPSAEAEIYRQKAHRNGERLIARPTIGLLVLTQQHATFTQDDLARLAHRHSDSKGQFDQVLSALRAAPELIALGHDARGVARYTSLDMLFVEQRLERSAQLMAQTPGHAVSARSLDKALEQGRGEEPALSSEQRDAVEHVVQPHGLSAIVGYAGSGKGVVLGVARQAWEAQGYRVQGAALSGVAAENLQDGAAIASRTLASLEHAWSKGRDLLTARDVLVIDEAGLVGSRQMQAVIEHAQRAGAKVVLVGDVEQLQAIEAGAAFRMITERHGAAEITNVRRQRAPWQAAATQALAVGRVEEALAAYQVADNIRGHADGVAARRAVVEGWAANRQAMPDRSQLILAHSIAEVRALNALARSTLRAQGRLGPDHRVQTAEGERLFAVHDRVIFRRNSGGLGVKNGTAGVITDIHADTLAVRLDGGRGVAIDLATYNHLDHGYATTIHRAQGVTVDHVHLLASALMDRHSAYVALSRHRHGVVLHYGRDQFASQAALAQALGRARPKDMALDYVGAFAARRALNAPSDMRSGPTQTTSRTRSSYNPTSEGALGVAIVNALERYAAVVIDIQHTQRQGHALAPPQRERLDQAAKTIMALWPGAAGHLATTLKKNPGLLSQIGQGRADLAVAALLAQRAKENTAQPQPGWRSSDQRRSADRAR
jgi:Ti-type conjugative transfer relaxase TraA